MIRPSTGSRKFGYKDKLGYKFNVKDDNVIIGDITHHIDVKLEPFWP